MDDHISEPDDVLPDGRLVLDTPVALPDVLDVLVVGGGPAGTGAAFRAKELGLAALVIEIDDVLKRIRDYDSAKPIKPDFGAARQMGFPKGGPLVEKLHFFTDVQGADLCRAWKTLYRRHGVPAQIGVEFVGLEPGDAGVWQARVRNHRTGSNGVVRARHVVLALGAGSPRRLDVPGEVRAIAHRLAGAARYVGKPACVIGGGVSAIEAVLAISAAKAAAADDTPVYWSHRGEQMPKPPRALENALEEAMFGNRNVRFLAGSEASEIVETGEGRVFRLKVGAGGGDGPPGAAPVMAFDASRVLACIGQEIDWPLFRDIGIHPVTGGTRVRKTFLLNALLESRQPNVYVIGDTLNTAYLECAGFDGDPSVFREVKHRGNIKASMTDGVAVIEAIAQRLGGAADVRVEVKLAGGPTVSLPPAFEAPRPDRPPPPRPAALVRLIDREVEAESFELPGDRVCTIGRRGSDICFPNDTNLAERHAAIVPGPDGYRVRDEGSADGVFLHMREGRGRVVAPGTLARMGEQWLVIGSKDDPLRLTHHDAHGKLVGRLPAAGGHADHRTPGAGHHAGARRRAPVAPPCVRRGHRHAGGPARSEQRERHLPEGRRRPPARRGRCPPRRSPGAALRSARSARPEPDLLHPRHGPASDEVRPRRRRPAGRRRTGRHVPEPRAVVPVHRGPDPLRAGREQRRRDHRRLPSRHLR